MRDSEQAQSPEVTCRHCGKEIQPYAGRWVDSMRLTGDGSACSGPYHEPRPGGSEPAANAAKRIGYVTAAQAGIHPDYLPPEPQEVVKLSYRRWATWVEFPDRDGYVVRRRLVSMRAYSTMNRTGLIPTPAPDGQTVMIQISGLHILPRGGEAIATILNREGDIIGTGRAVCNRDDNFNRRTARDKAVGRARSMVKRGRGGYLAANVDPRLLTDAPPFIRDIVVNGNADATVHALREFRARLAALDAR